MKVLLASPYNEAGGIARWTGHILRYWEQFGKTDVDIILLREPRPLFKGFNNKSPLRRFISGVYTYLLYCIYEFRFFRKNNCDVLHVCSSASLGLFKDLLMLSIANRFHIKTIIHFRFGRIPELFLKKNWEYRMLVKVINKANLTITIDKKSFNTLRENGFESITNIPNPISPEVIRVVENNSLIERDKNLILFVGQCYLEKGIYELIDSCNDIKDITLRFVGSVNEATKKEMLQRAKGVNNIEILGNLPYEEVIKQMLSCSVFVLPTYTEGFPNVILESMACGCSIVTTSVGAIPEMLDIENGSKYGICVEPRDVQGLKQSIEYMLYDREYAIKCGNLAKLRVNKLYSMPSVWKELVFNWKTILQ